MRIITLEEHYTDRRLMEANNSLSIERPPMSPEQQEVMDFLRKRAFPGEQLLDFDKRIAFMDEQKIDMQVLSLTSTVNDGASTEDAKKICRMANDITREHMDEYPGRFGGFATLHLMDPKEAVDELRRCVEELGFSGAMLAGRQRGRFYNEAEFLPIFEAAAELGVPVYFHPAFVPREVQETYYLSDAYSYVVGSELSSAGYGWHSEVGIQIARLILSGIFDRFPDLHFISGHWGETIPAFLERMDAILDQDITHLERSFSDYYKDQVYITPSGIMSNDQLEYLVKVMGADHMMYALDYPYVEVGDSYAFLTEANISDEAKELIAHGNAERLMGL